MAKISPLMVIPPLVFLGLASLFLVGMFRDDPEALPSARIGQQAPALQITELPGKALFDDETLRDGNLKLVNYWASWCAPCRVEHPNLEALRAEGLPIYGINYKDDPDNALAFLAELGDPYEAVGADNSGRAALDWGVYGVPETYLIDGDGNILLRVAGPLVQRVIDSQLRPALEKAR
ncbi:DsbE family thiol:disulfide interchange protein [Phaeobacter sp. 22II1-1F12B]|uniref:DsbE family thiol:disulfide interchange protein n=1 Tax=Phaeobacter sp. 22II1-1F12B TaxID=1317111 RepID=UPI000B51E83A|nr:DsbE family thiol:disulfide interchange protein [Phaeobacter sp. 22II1-1F12B]OWU81534.1 thiol:disulfide interchange protein [Phaeobacter sp. 22II1-1F12B]